MPASAPQSDDELLDGLLSRFLDDLAEGRTIDVDAVLAGRPDLAGRVRETLALARGIAVQRPVALPAIADHVILEELGRGGMGVVYLAEQTSLRRRVALKTMTAARMAGPRARARFEREVRTIARAQHPNIVPVYETGEADGVPYFTMEYVAGRSLAAALRELDKLERRPGQLVGADLWVAMGCPAGALRDGWPTSYVAGVCRLVLKIAEALAHAHAQGIVHRDLKPSNVLVRTDGEPLLVDFGLAQVEDEASLTISGDFVGTPHYASPEQLDRQRGPVDARSDVYSLGITLYELLTSTVPFRGATAHEVLRAMQAQAAPSPRAANPQVPRDLDTICRTAIEQDRARRYPSAAAFAEDLRRLLELRPIVARPAGSMTRAVRWVQRNRARAAVLGLASLLVLGAPTALWLQQLRANRRIQAQAARVEAVLDFQRRMLESVDPEKLGRDTKVRDVLDQARRELATRFADAPDILATLSESLATSYFTLGMAAEAEPLFAAAARLEEASAGPQAWHTLMMRLWLGATLVELGRHAEAEQIFDNVCAIATSVHGPFGATTLTALFNKAKSLAARGEQEAALRIAKEVVDGRVATLGPDHEHTLAARSLVAMLQSNVGHPALAEAAYQDIVASYTRKYSADHVETLKARNNQAGCLLTMGQAERAAAIMREILVTRRSALGDEHPTTIHSIASLAECLGGCGRLLEARPLLEEAVAAARKLRSDHWIRLDILYKHCRCVLGLRDYAAAEAAACELEQLRMEGSWGPDHRDTLAVSYLRARIAEEGGDLVEGERRYRAVLDRARAALGPEDVWRWAFQNGLGRCLARMRRFPEAEQLLGEAYERMTALAGRQHADTVFSLQCLTEARLRRFVAWLFGLRAVSSLGAGATGVSRVR
jgi:tRNA A-37 threonylcarbamoyl transferase component Bud32/tetratricopeptide (TPR) repeat protein